MPDAARPRRRSVDGGARVSRRPLRADRCRRANRPGRVDDDGLDVAAMARRSPRAKLAYVTPSHQFPLGVPMSLSRRLALLKWATDASAWILEDDYDSEFRYGTRPIPCLHGLDVDGRVIYVGSFSKTVFPSLRLGFVIVPDDLQERMVAARRAADLHPPAMISSSLLISWKAAISSGTFDGCARRTPSGCTHSSTPRPGTAPARST